MMSALVLLIGLIMSGCQTAIPVFEDSNISYETAMSHVDSLDKGGRWLSLGIKEINKLEGLGQDERNLINHHLFRLIKDEDLRFDEERLGEFVTEMKTKDMAKEAVSAVEQAHIRVSSPVNLHDGYWVGTIKPEGSFFV